MNPQLKEFLQPYDKDIQDLALELRLFITTIAPEANELIWDNYNALAIAYSKSEKLKDAFCHLSIYSKHVNFGFNRGSELIESKLKLKGTGKLIRHIQVNGMDTFPIEEVKKSVMEAIAISDELNPGLTKKNTLGISKVMSISKKKIRPKR